jgi:hypothetical protein
MKSNIFKSSLAIILLILFTGTKVSGIHEILHNHDHHHHGHHSHENFSGLYGQLDQNCDHDAHDHDQPQDNEEEEDCDLCDKIVLDNLSAFSSSEVSTSTEAPNHFYKNTITEYTSEIHSTSLSTALFSRPPPVLG